MIAFNKNTKKWIVYLRKIILLISIHLCLKRRQLMMLFLSFLFRVSLMLILLFRSFKKFNRLKRRSSISFTRFTKKKQREYFQAFMEIQHTSGAATSKCRYSLSTQKEGTGQYDLHSKMSLVKLMAKYLSQLMEWLTRYTSMTQWINSRCYTKSNNIPSKKVIMAEKFQQLLPLTQEINRLSSQGVKIPMSRYVSSRKTN